MLLRHMAEIKVETAVDEGNTKISGKMKGHHLNSTTNKHRGK